MDLDEYRDGNCEQRGPHGESSWCCYRAGCLCGSSTGGGVPGRSKRDTAESECICASYNYRSGDEQRSYYILECARSHDLRDGSKRHAIERHGKRCRHVLVHTGGRYGTESRKADNFGHIRAE